VTVTADAQTLQSFRRAAVFNWQFVAALGVVAVLIILVALPIYYLLVESFRTPAGFSLGNYTRILSLPRFQLAMWRTLEIGLICAAVGTLLGGGLAWLVSQTNMPGRSFVRLSVLGSFVVPGFVNALSWALLGGPNAGFLNRLWMAATGASTGFFNIYSMYGLAIVCIASTYSLAFIFMYNAFQAMDIETENAARVLGAGRARILLTITLPLALPAILAGSITIFLQTVVLYGAPAVIGVPARIYVITTQIGSLFEYPPQLGLAAALSLPLLLVTGCLLWMQRKIVGGRSYATIGGKGGRRELIDLGMWKWVMAACSILVIVIAFIIPNGLLVITSFLRQAYLGITLDNLTVDHYRYVLFDYIAGIPSIKNSMVTAGVAATLAVALAAVAAFIAERRLVWFGGGIAFFAMSPLVIPAMVFAVGLVTVYSGGVINLYGTLTILVLAYLTLNLPIAFMNCSTALANVHGELESAARILGASTFQVLRDITAPLIKNGLLAAWILVFSHAVKDLSASVLLYTTETTVISTAIMDVYGAQNWGAVAALSVILLALSAMVVLVGYRMIGGNVINPKAS
jgi:iron(III) transport system permease protein